MGKRIYKRGLALGVAVITLISMSSVSHATEADFELTAPEENGLVLSTDEGETLNPVSEIAEEKVATEIEHEPEEKVIDAEVEDVIDEITEETEVSEEFIENEDNTNGDINNAVAEEENTEETEQVSDNTIPDNAYIITNGDVTQGTIVNEDEFRWYAFELNSKSKYSIWLQMESSLDADLYIYEYDTSTGQLVLIGGSANDGAGVEEFDTSVLTEGLYFVAVSGYASAGNYAFTYIESTADVEYETNDTEDTASAISLSSDISGVIDNPYDYDYYTFTLDKPTIVRYSINSNEDYKLAYAGSTGDAPIVIDDTLIKMYAGTYTFVVYSPSFSYSTSSSYVVRFNKVGELADESIVPFIAINEKAGVVFQTNFEGTICYVNGHLIDISYQFDYTNYYDPRNGQNYHISLKNIPGVVCQIWPEELEAPSVVYYQSSTKPAKRVGSKPLLSLMYYRENPNVHFYTIQCVGSGIYKNDTKWEDLKYVIVFIDPDDGKLVDIMEYNYFYQFASGTNNISFSNYYGGKMKFTYSEHDYK